MVVDRADKPDTLPMDCEGDDIDITDLEAVAGVVLEACVNSAAEQAGTRDVNILSTDLLQSPPPASHCPCRAEDTRGVDECTSPKQSKRKWSALQLRVWPLPNDCCRSLHMSDGMPGCGHPNVVTKAFAISCLPVLCITGFLPPYVILYSRTPTMTPPSLYTCR